MRRKLVKQGQNALTVTIPAIWTKSNHLKAGDEIEIEQIESDLLITTEYKHKKEETKLKLETNDFYFIKGSIKTLYRLGYDLIEINFKTKIQEKHIKETVDTLLGFEIVDEKKDQIVIENITEPMEEKQEVLLRRIFLITKETFEIIINDIKLNANKKNRFNNLNLVKELTLRADKYDGFCRRSISKRRFEEKKIVFYWEMYQRLLLIQYSLNNIYQTLETEKPNKISIKLIETIEFIKQQYLVLYKIYFQNEPNLIQTVNLEIIKERHHKIHPLIMKSTGFENVIFTYCSELCRSINLLSLPLIAIMQ
jgi:antitoxin component of MazEF toxin-antitoxin module